MNKLIAVCFTNDAGEVFDRAYYRLGREYGYVFKDVVVELTIRGGGLKCGIHEPDKTVLAGCNPEIVERLIADLNGWLAENGGDFYDLEQGEDRWVVYKENKKELCEAVEGVIVEQDGDPSLAAQLIVNTWLS
jgi:hypothetical protein